MKAVFSFDAAWAVLLAASMSALLFSAYQLHVASFLSGQRVAEKERVALQAAEFLLSYCTEDGGLLACDDAFRYSNRLDAGAVEGISPYLVASLRQRVVSNDSFGASFLSVRVLDLQERVLASAREPGFGGGVREAAGPERACVRRLALWEETEVVLEACAG